MNSKMEWERSDDAVIDLNDLFRQLIRNMKWAVLCGVVFAILLGAYTYNRYLHPVSADYAKEAKGVRLNSTELQAVQNAEALIDENIRIQGYLEESAYMNINPNRENVVTMLYGIFDIKKSAREQVTENYLSYINDGGAAAYIQEQKSVYPDLGTEYLSELFSASSTSKEGGQQEIILKQEDAFPGFYIRVIGSDMEKTEQLSGQIQAALEEYSLKVEEKVGTHKLKLLDLQSMEKYDMALADKIKTYHVSLSDNSTKLSVLTGTFSRGQQILYNAYLQEKGLVVEVEDEVTMHRVILYAILGALIGVCLYCGVYAFLYLCNGKVKSTRELEQKYTFPVLGAVYGKRKLSQDHSGQLDKLAIRLGMLCEEKKIAEFAVLPTIPLKEEAQNSLKTLQERLEKQGIQSKCVENILDMPGQWGEIRKTEYVVPVYDMGHTAYNKINEEMKFYQENHIEVLGVIAVER